MRLLSKRCVFSVILIISALVVAPGCGGGGGGGVSGSHVDNSGSVGNNSGIGGVLTNQPPADSGTGSEAAKTDPHISGTVSVSAGAARFRADGASASAAQSSETPLKDASVTLASEDGKKISLKTDASGAFALEREEIENGIYKFEVSKDARAGSMYVEIDDDKTDLDVVFENSTDFSASIQKVDYQGGWRRDVNSDGSYSIIAAGKLTENHESNGLTVTYRQGDEDWFLDENGNFVNDDVDSDAPELDSSNDSDGDMCHDMRDFKDSDNDNDGADNFDDDDYNTNLLAAQRNSINDDCMNNVPVFSLELKLSKNQGDAPLKVNAVAIVKGSSKYIEKYEWITGKPGVAPIETTTPELSVTYDKYGTFVLTVIVHFAGGKKLIDTSPVYVVKSSYGGDLSYSGTLNNNCGDCMSMEVDIDQYGNIFTISRDELTHNDVMTVADGNNEYLDDFYIDQTKIGNLWFFDIDIDENGFIYGLSDGWVGNPGIYIFNSLGELVRKIDNFGGAFEYRGVSVAKNGNIYSSHVGRLVRCEKSKNYECTELPLSFDPDKRQIAMYSDVAINDENDEIGVLYNGRIISFYDENGDVTRSLDIGYQFEFHEIEFGPNGDIYGLSYGSHGKGEYSSIEIFDNNGNSKGSVNVPGWVEGIAVSKQGVLYVCAPWSMGRSLVVYAPDYIIAQNGAASAGRSSQRVGPFIVHNVKWINLN